MPGFFQKSHIDKRNLHVGKFQGLDPETSTTTLLDILTTHDARYAYRKSDDPHVYAQFAKESDLLQACTGSFYKGNIKITGMPKNEKWTDRQQFLAENRTNRRTLPSTIAKNGLQNTSISVINVLTENSDASTSSNVSNSSSTPVKSPLTTPRHFKPEQKGKTVMRNHLPKQNRFPATGTNRTPLNESKRRNFTTHRTNATNNITNCQGSMDGIVDLC